jgi:8-oxo-dGTP diphosphatase
MQTEINQLYGDKVRVRTCGICWRHDEILLVNHRGIGPGDWWAPPAGGLEPGDTVHERIQREFIEETGLSVSVEKFMFCCEFIRKPLHAVELFFEVKITGGTLLKGQDPELSIIEDVRFFNPKEIATLPTDSLHGIFSLVRSVDDLRTLSGFFTI